LEKLEASGERDTIAGRHLRYLRDRFAELWRLTQQTGQSADLGAALQIELGDVRWALDGALVRGTVVDAAELLASIGARWRLAGLNAEGMARLEAYLAALPETESRLRAHLATSLSFLLGESGARAQSFELAAQAVADARVSTDQWALAAALHRFARNAMFLDRLEEAERALAEAEAIPGASPNFRMVLLETRACLVQLRGDLESAARMFEEIRRECRAQGDDHREKVAAYNLAEVEHARGCTPRAIAVVRELLPAARSGADTGQLALILQNLAGYLSAVGDSFGAAAAAREAIRIRAAHEPRHVLVAATIEHLALALALCGDLERAAVLESYANAALEEHRFVREFTERASHEALTQLLCLELEPGELARLLAEGAALTPEAAIVLALVESQPRRGDSQPPPRGAPVAGQFI
jgi:ATP/maltotriose-dependent transcriptional regulator MalT